MSGERKIHVRWLGDYRTEIDVRGVHTLRGDETPQFGGEDSGPMPTEMLLASLGSCLCLAISHFARKSRKNLAGLEVEASAVKDMEAFRFQEIQLRVHAELEGGDAAKLVERAKRYCFVSNTVIEGCPVHIETISVDPATAAANAEVAS